jgi:hypothetical protein
MDSLSRLSCLVLFAIGAVSSFGAAVVPVAGEYPLVGDVVGHQKYPDIAIGPTGGLVVWQNATAESGGERILVQVLDENLMGVGFPQVVSQNVRDQNDLNPAVILLEEGVGAVVWEAGERGATDIFLRLVDSQGNPVGGIQRVNTYVEGVQKDPAIVRNTKDQIMVLWSSEGQDGDGEGIYGQNFDLLGRPAGGPYRVNQTTRGSQSRPSVSWGSSTGVAVWSGEIILGKNSSGGVNMRRNILGRLLGENGPVGNEFIISHSNVVALEGVVESGLDGAFGVVWSQRDEVVPTNAENIYARMFNEAGLPAGDPARLNTYLPSSQNGPQLTQVEGQFMALWNSSKQDTQGEGVRGRLLSGGSEFGVNAQENYDQSMCALSGDGVQTFLAVWVNTIRVDHSILSAQRYRLGEGALAPEEVDVAAGPVEIVGEEPMQRQTNRSVVADRAAVISRENAGQGASLQIAAPDNGSGLVTKNPANRSAYSNLPRQVPQPASVESVSGANAYPGRTQPESITTPNVSAAALNALQTMSTQSQISNRSYVPPVQQQASTGNRYRLGTAPTRSTMLMSGVSYGSRLQGLRVLGSSSGGSVRLGSGASSMAANTVARSRQSAPSASTGSSHTVSASDRASAIRATAVVETEKANYSSQIPVPAGVVRNGRGTSLQWISRAGGRYQVQASNDKFAWENLGSLRRGTGSVDAHGVSGLGFKYYRVVQVN